MERNDTRKHLKKVATEVERTLLQQIDAECEQKQCSRADVIRWALLDRFNQKQEIPSAVNQ